MHRKVDPITRKILPSGVEKRNIQLPLTKSERILIDFIRKYEITPDDDFRELLAMYYLVNIDNEMICSWIMGKRKVK